MTEVLDDGEEFDIVSLLAVVICVCCGACAAGLTMGLLSLDGMKLKVKSVTGTDDEKRVIARLLPVLSDHHFLLCTLLIFNAAANEAMPIFLDRLVPSWAAVIVSVTLVLIFGEIVPTATFTGPQQLKLVSSLVSVVYLLQIIFYPVARPMAWLLDMWLGHDDDDDYFSRDELAAMVRILRSKGAAIPYTDKAEVVSPMMRDEIIQEGRGGDSDDEDGEEPLTGNEVNVITGVLGLSKMTVLNIFTDLNSVNMLSDDQVFDEETVGVIVKCGHSRLPVFKGKDRKNIVGVFRTKTLIGKDPEDSLTMDQFKLTQPLVVGAGQSPLTVLNLFQQGLSHIALVSHDPEGLLAAIESGASPDSSCEPIGIVTLEDVIEAMIQSEIYDEEDITDRGTGGTSGARATLFKLSMSARPTALSTDSRPTVTRQHTMGKDTELDTISSIEEGRGTVGRQSGKSSQYTGHSGSVDRARDISSNGSATSAGRDSSLKSFYRQYGGVHDVRGSPLIPSQDGAHRKQKLERQASGGDDKIPFPSGETNTFGRHLVGGAHAKNRKITPSSRVP
jgi:metal transporter CNNM